MIKYLKSILDSNESPSFGRTSSAIVILFLLLWSSFLTVKNNFIPEIPYGWIAIIAVLWGGTATKEILKHKPTKGD